MKERNDKRLALMQAMCVFDACAIIDAHVERVRLYWQGKWKVSVRMHHGEVILSVSDSLWDALAVYGDCLEAEELAERAEVHNGK